MRHNRSVFDVAISAYPSTVYPYFWIENHGVLALQLANTP